jgi:hypothetical protein
MAQNELGGITAALLDALREAQDLARAGEYGPPLREVLDFCRDLVTRADVALASYPKACEDARVVTFYMTEQLAALETLLEP